jgi:signal transduction histidine kinase/CheY-like chemotaxis protein
MDMPKQSTRVSESSKLCTEQAGLLYANAVAANVTVMAAGLFCTVSLWTQVDRSALLSWLAALATSAIIRLYLISRYRHRDAATPVETWARLYIYTTLLVGIIWGGFTLFIYQSNNLFIFSFIYIIIIAVITASIPVLAVIRGAFYAYNLPPTFMLSMVLILDGALNSVLFGLGILVYFLLIALTGNNLHRRIVLSLKLEISNKELIDQLQAEISQRKTVQQDLELAKEIAVQANHSKSQFLANMSHEIRTPLHAIIGMSEPSLATGIAPEQIEQFGKINLSGQHLLRIINGILDLSKIEAGKLELEQTNFKMKQVMDTLTTIVLEKAYEKGLAFNLELDPALECTLRGDPLRLGQVLINLTNNAIKFTERGGITVRILLLQESEDALLLRFEVQDSGAGIDEAKMEKIFQPFQQADSSTTRQYGGTGLGLSICKQLVTLMGGEIGIQSQAENGSIFWFTVQLERSNTENTDLADESNDDTSCLKGAYILLVDDNSLNLDIAQRHLENVGIVVKLADSGRQAVQLVDDEHFDLVLMDVQMPNMDGLEATRAIRATSRHNNLPIIAMTANATQQERERCISAGMNDFITKPFDLKRLYNALTQCLSQKH